MDRTLWKTRLGIGYGPVARLRVLKKQYAVNMHYRLGDSNTDPDLGPQRGLYTKNDCLTDSVNVTARLNNRLSENPASTNSQRVMACFACVTVLITVRSGSPRYSLYTNNNPQQLHSDTRLAITGPTRQNYRDDHRNVGAMPSQAKVLTGGGDLCEAQVVVPLSVSHSCV